MTPVTVAARTAVAAVALTLVSLPLTLPLLGSSPAAAACGVERWAGKTGTDADASAIDLSMQKPTTIAALSALPAPPSLPDNNRIRPTETTVYSITATLTIPTTTSSSATAATR